MVSTEKGTIKINVDAPLLDSHAAVGVVARNFEDIPLVVQIIRGSHCSIEAAEAFAMLKGMELAV